MFFFEICLLHLFPAVGAGKFSEQNPSSNPRLCHGFPQPPFHRRSHNFQCQWQSCEWQCCCHWPLILQDFFGFENFSCTRAFACLLFSCLSSGPQNLLPCDARAWGLEMDEAIFQHEQAQAESICYHCLATKGTHNLDGSYSDLSAGAIWQGTVLNCNHPWRVEPALASLQWFSIKKVSMDLLHIWHLGVARDLHLDALDAYFLFCLLKGLSN